MARDEPGLSHWQQLLQPIEASKNWVYLVEQAMQALAEGGGNGAVEEAYLSYLAGKGLVELKNWIQAEPLLQRSVHLHPDFAFSFHLLGLCKAEAEDWQAAYCAASCSTDLAPDFAYGWHARGYAALQLGNNKEAKACLKRAIELNKTISWFHTHYYLAELRSALEEGDTAAAEAHLLTALMQYPDNAEYRQLLMKVLEAQFAGGDNVLFGSEIRERELRLEVHKRLLSCFERRAFEANV